MLPPGGHGVSAPDRPINFRISRPQAGPRPGADYPRGFEEFDAWFRNENACLEYLERLRWPEGFRCPRCGGGESWRTSRGLHQCRQCRFLTSTPTGTIFEQTHKPLRTWPIRALMVLTCSGVSFFHGSNDGQKGMGLIMLILIGTVPTAYALNHAVTASDMQDFIAACEQAGHILDRHVDKAGFSARTPAPR